MHSRSLRLLAVLSLVAAAACGAPTEPRRVLLISIDTCRADHLSAYGYERETSPTLAALAARGVRFENAFSQVPDTTPSHATLLTSQYPFHHGAANGVPLGPAFVTLAEMLRGADFRTAAFVSGWTMTARASGLAQGFEVYDDVMTHAGTTSANINERQAEDTTTRALAWLEQAADDPFLLFVHYFDPHAVYQPPSPYDTMFAAAAPPVEIPRGKIPGYARIGTETDLGTYVARYDGEIRYVDDQIARLFAALEARGVLDDTLVVVTADHGEALGEHDRFFNHGFDLYDPALHVPLILAYPGRIPTGASVDGIAQSVDVVPTILELLGIDAGFGLAGRSLVPAIEGGVTTGNTFTLARTTKTLTYPHLKIERDIHDMFSVRTEDWKLIERDDGVAEVYDLATDPGEQRNVADELPRERERMRGVLQDALSPMARVTRPSNSSGRSATSSSPDLYRPDR